MKSNNRGETVVIVLVIAGLLGIAAWALKPKFLDGDSRRAERSRETTAELIDAQKARSAAAAASVVKIGEANATAPDSLEKDFIAKEVPVALSNLEAADAQKLIEAERRKVAVLTGQVEAANALYEKALKAAQAEAARAQKAEAEKLETDNELSRVAAERLGAERQKRIFMLVAAGILVLWLYVKVTHLSPNAIAEAVTDLRTNGKVDAIQAIDSVASRTQQRLVRLFTKLHK